MLSLNNFLKNIFDKASLVFNTLNEQKFLKNMFVKPIIENHDIICFKCNMIGHKSIDYTMLKFENVKVKQIWISKGTIVTIIKGSKKAWLSKNTT